MAQKIDYNHTCRNTNCTKGPNGTRAQYYECNACIKGKPRFWRAFCCSIECYQEYMLAKQPKPEPKEEPVAEIEESPVIEQGPNVEVETEKVPIVEQETEVNIDDLVEAIIAKTDEAIENTEPVQDGSSDTEPVRQYNRKKKKYRNAE